MVILILAEFVVFSVIAVQAGFSLWAVALAFVLACGVLFEYWERMK